MEWWDEKVGTTFFLRGISATLEGAIGIAALHRLAGVGQNDTQQDLKFDADHWQIEEVPVEVMLRNDIPENDQYANAGAIAMYDLDGIIIRKLNNE